MGIILEPIYFVISLVLVGCHKALSTFLDPDGGAAWALSIVGLTLFVRAATIPLFTKQIKSSRNMQLLAPQLKELQKKYGHDKERLQRETMDLYKETGTNPFSSCLPLLIQMPIFIALFGLLRDASNEKPHSFLTEKLAVSFGESNLWGIGISDSFRDAQSMDVRVVAAVMVAIMVATTFYMQKQLMSKNMPAEAMTGQAAQIQKVMLYVLPLGFLVSGFAFQMGLLVYMVVSNLWTLGQQFWLITNNPTPGSEAFEQKQQRDLRKGRVPDQDPTKASSAVELDVEAPPRSQPKKQSRKDRKQSDE